MSGKYSANDNTTHPKWLLLLMELRAPFFTGSVVPVLLGAAIAFYRTGIWNCPLFVMCLLGIVLVHAGANVINDYFDHKSGNDEANTQFVRPFTGGSRMIQKGLLTPREVLTLSLVCFALGGIIALCFIMRFGMPVLIIAIIGMAGGFFYSAPPLSLGARGLGELVVALNFGILPVVATNYVLTRHFSWDVTWLALPIACLITAILFINQFQDSDADRAVGKRHWVVRLGKPKAIPVYAALMLAWAIPVLLGVVLEKLPRLSLLALLPLVPACRAIAIARRHYLNSIRLAPANAITIIVHLSVGLLLAAALIVARWWQL